ncbi:MAG: AAA family ATPase [Conexivisphaerales archaeon]
MPEAEPFIKEVILENFMSYDYGRIPLKPGLNVVLGPNGAGKSSILLGISVALGQAYTERSRRLSDLVKRGKDIARVTLLLNNSKRDGKRLLPYKSDLIHLSRYIRKDGTYWFEIDFKEASKIEVTQTLSRLGLNPDNMLVIMHQGLGDAFSMVNPQEKLVMVEDAVGLSPYRKSLLEARERLERIKTEKEERERELQNLSAGLERWKEQYEKFLKLQEVRRRLDNLRVEEAWARVAKIENSLAALDERLEKVRTEIKSLESRVKENEENVSLAMTKVEQAINSYGMAERKRERLRYGSVLYSQMTKGSKSMGIEDLAKMLNGLDLKRPEEAEEMVGRLDSEVLNELNSLKDRIEGLSAYREKLAVLKYRLNETQKEERQTVKQREDMASELKVITAEAERLGNRPERVGNLNDIQAEMKVAELQLKEMGDVASDAEAMYNEFKNRMSQLSQRIEELDRNKQETLKEIQERFSVWKRELQSLVAELSRKYAEVLSMVNANGRVALINSDDPTDAGLILMVSFRGDQLIPLDAYTQSGGERSTAVAAFLLALQGKVVSPFRAVDEFDVHMDKVNRQLFMKAIYEMFRRDDTSQYLVITPIEPDVYDAEANYIMVHKVASSSRARQVEKVAAKQ